MTRTVAETFSLTHAKHLASKVTADMKRCQQMYRKPLDADINNYGTELSLLLRDGYLAEFECGFKTGDGVRKLTLRYVVSSSGDLTTNDLPGGISSGVDISGANWYTLLTHSSSWHQLADAERDRIRATLPISREFGSAPSDGNGIWVTDKTYSASGVAMNRSIYKTL